MGTGSIHRITDQRTGAVRWVAQVSIGGRGQRRYRRRWRRSERDARAALREMLDAAPRGMSRQALSDFLDGWVRDVRGLRPRTRIEYANAIALHINPTIGHIRLPDLTPAHVEGMIRSLEPVLSPKSIRNVVGVLRRALTFAVRDELVTRNVASREFIDPVHVPSSEPRVLTASERTALLRAAKGDWLEALIVTADGTGMRQGELLGLVWGDLAADHVNVQKALVRRDGRYIRDDLKTERSERRVPLAPSVLAALRDHRARLEAAGWMPIATGPVFPSVNGAPLSSGWVTHRFYALCAAAGIERAPFKVLRATFASRLHDAGVPERRIQDLLGHKRDSKVTQRHYVGAGEWDAAVTAVSEVVG